MFNKTVAMPKPSEALAGRSESMPVTNTHAVNQHPIQPPFGAQYKEALFGMGCFWGAERKFWQLKGVFSTAVGYAAGFTPNPTYQEVCSGMTGQNEVVLVIYDPDIISYETLLEVFWTSHNPTQGFRQGNDKGTQYRSGIYFFNSEQQAKALATREHFQKQLTTAGEGKITTEIQEASTFYYAEDYHQQYLHKNPNGYCGLGGLSISYR